MDIAIAAGILAAATGEAVVTDGSGGWPVRLFAIAVTTAPLVWRSVLPLRAVLVVSSGYALAVMAGLPTDDALVPFFAPLLAVCSLAVEADLGRAILGGAFAAACYATVGLSASAGDVGVDLAGVAMAVLVGRAMRVIGLESDVLAARAASAEHGRDEAARAAVAKERARIARELHDVIGHTISVMGVQAGAVRRRLATDQIVERDALLSVERLGRDAVDEMRRLLGILRDGGRDDDAGFGTIERAEDLVADMRNAGLRIDLRIVGEPAAQLPAGRAFAAYRILQESLTNVLKHAPNASAQVTITHCRDSIQVDVTNNASPGVKTADTGAGHGLLGMRERATLYGGSLESGPRPDGGFGIRATIPVTA